VSSRKILEGKFKFFPTCLPCAPLRHTAKRVFAECLILAHGKRTCLPCAKLSPCVSSAGSRQRSKDAVCLEFAVRFGEYHTAKTSFAVCLSFAVCCFGLHTANTTFAVCPRFSTRQIFGHTANARFPVVIDTICTIKVQ